MCNNCIHKIVCSKYIATGGVKNCEHFKEERKGVWKYYRKVGVAVCMKCFFERKLGADFGKAISCPNCGADMRGTKNG